MILLSQCRTLKSGLVPDFDGKKENFIEECRLSYFCGIIYNIIYWRKLILGRPLVVRKFYWKLFYWLFWHYWTPFSSRLKCQWYRWIARVEQKAEEGDKNIRLLSVLEQPNHFLSTICVGTTSWLTSYLLGRVFSDSLGHVIAGWMGNTKQLMQLEAFILAFLTYISIVFGELQFKTNQRRTWKMSRLSEQLRLWFY